MEKIKNKESFPDKVLNYLGETALNLFDFGFRLVLEPDEIIKNYGPIFSYAPRAIYNLKKSPYFKQEGQKIYVTEKGRMRIIENILKNKKCQKLNGLWLGIIFDIPEASRRERAFLRKELTSAGCKELQKSVWITPFDIEKELKILLPLWKKDFKGDVRFLKIKEISGEEEIKEYFEVS